MLHGSVRKSRGMNVSLARGRMSQSDEASPKVRLDYLPVPM